MFLPVQIIVWALITSALILSCSTSKQNLAECPDGWAQFYSLGTPATCVLFSSDTTQDLDAAQNNCEEKNASLLIIDTEAKFTFFEKLVLDNDGISTNVWVGLIRYWHYGEVWWKTKGGDIKAKNIPSGLKSYTSWDYYTGLFYKDGNLRKQESDWFYNKENGRYICEKNADCKKGYIGESCQHECKCYNEECDAKSKNITCSFGCQVGWMGRNCTQKKGDAEVRYFCVNSKDQGKFVQVIIDRKGVKYDRIDLVGDDGQWLTTRCGNVVTTHPQKNDPLSTINMKIYVENSQTTTTQQTNSKNGGTSNSNKRVSSSRVTETNDTRDGSASSNNSDNATATTTTTNNSVDKDSNSNNNSSNNNNNNNNSDQQCKGENSKSGIYEWTLKIQEHEHLVSRNDQEIHIECDIDKADDFQLSDEADIKRERWFRKSDIRKPIEYLEEHKEVVELKILDPSTNERLSDDILGSPVILQIEYGAKEGSVAKGVRPYNCYAESTDGKNRIKFLDENGCVLKKSFPISEFRKKGEKSLITEPFPLFGFPGSESVQFSCTYFLCLRQSECPVGCVPPSATHSSRVRREVHPYTKEEEMRVTTTIRVTMFRL